MKKLILLCSTLMAFNVGAVIEKAKAPICLDNTATFKNNKRMHLTGEAKPYSGKNLCFWKGGQRKSKTTYKEGLLDGLNTTWHKNGQIESTGFIKNGNGEGKVWHPNGQLRLILITKNGKPEGLMTEWYENGQKKLERFTKNGKLEGLWAEWYEDGQRKHEFGYINGKPEGLMTEWHENGQKKTSVSMKNGKLIDKTEWHSDGQIK